MKLLNEEEVQGHDYTQKTIDKWDEFLKKAVWNLGFKKDLIDNMYPYKQGVPLKDGTFLPVSQKTGRVFFRLSWADYLCYSMATLQNEGQIILYLFKLWRDTDIFLKFFSFIPEAEEDYKTLKEVLNTKVKNDVFKHDPLLEKYLNIFLEHSRINALSKEIENASAIFRTISSEKECKSQIIKIYQKSDNCSVNYSTRYYYLIYYEPLNNEFDDDSIGPQLINALYQINYSSGQLVTKNVESIFQKFLVISLNPIDKLMCSTKQAFSSCMSISRQNESSGTNSGPALGLPTLFDSDSTFLVFMTKGVYKNMYWEKEQWDKPGSDRDPDKAYKYSKMACRALTYQGLPTLALRNQKEELQKRNKELADKLFKTTRLFIGRHYSAAGEWHSWTIITEWLLGQMNISTGVSYTQELGELRDYLNENYDADPSWIGVNTMEWIYRGTLKDNSVIKLDRANRIRSIYFDNLRIEYNEKGRAKRQNYYKKIDGELVDYISIRTGPVRSGSGDQNMLERAANCDMFKLMTGQQQLNSLYQYLKVCNFCGNIILDTEDPSQNYKGHTICNNCIKEKLLKKCESCGDLYSEKDKEEVTKHTLVNIWEYIYPNKYKSMEPVYYCRTKLDRIRRGPSRICARCGKVQDRVTYHGEFIQAVTQINIAEFPINISVCSSCLEHAIICDKCKRLIFLDKNSEPCILLPNKRVICQDCIDYIRLKKSKKEKLKDVIQDIKNDKFPDEIDIKDYDTIFKEENLSNATGTRTMTLRHKAILKNVARQINSITNRNPEEAGTKLLGVAYE